MSEKLRGTTPPQESKKEEARKYTHDEIIAIWKDEFLQMHELEIVKTVEDYEDINNPDKNKKVTEKELRAKLVSLYNRILKY